MKLSLIMATRDRPKLLPRAIASVLAQDDPRWELCVLDNGYTVRSLIPDDPRIAYRWSKASGPADAFQQALDMATGDVVMPLADDDMLASHTVRTVLEGIGDAEWGYAQTAFQRDGQTMFLLGDTWSLDRMRADYYLGGAVFWRRRLTDRLGGFDPAFDGAADYDLYLRFGEDSAPVFIPEVLYLYNDHPGTDTNVQHARQRDAAQRIRDKARGPVPRRTVSVVTPWIGHPELLAGYLRTVERADQTIVIDNGGAPRTERFSDLIVPESPLGFAESNNRGHSYATGDIVVFLNNDVEADPSWIDRLRADVEHGALYGPRIGRQLLAGVVVPYVEGWCVAATRDTWDRIGGWDAERFPKPYWEDVELSLRAVRKGIELRRAPWKLRHLGGVSTSTTPGAWDGFAQQKAIVESMVADLVGAAA